MKKLLLSLLSMVLLVPAFAQTYVPEGEVSGTWKLSDSPYRINGDIFIPENQELIILPGVRVEFEGNYFLKVRGKLTAKGTEASRIVFTARNASEGWDGIYMGDAAFDFYDSDAKQISLPTPRTSVMQFCDFQNGNSDDYSGCLTIHGLPSFVLTDCNFSNNESSDSGGSIFLKDVQNKTIDRCTFTDSEGTDSPGGAIKIGCDCNNITIESCVFTNCKSVVNGGAIAANNGDYDIQNLTINNCMFTNCIADGEDDEGGNGGAIFIGYASENIRISNNEFINCHSIENGEDGGNGGAIFIADDGTKMYITGNLFKNCSSTGYDGNGGNGGAIKMGNADGLGEYDKSFHEPEEDLFSEYQILNNTFENNSAYNNGGAISIGEYADGIINGNVFKMNQAGWDGGAIKLAYQTRFSLSNNVFSFNTAEDKGGALAVGRFEDEDRDLAKTTYQPVEEGFLTMHSNKIMNNTSSCRGGGIFIGYNRNLDIQDLLLVNNFAGTGGGAFFGAYCKGLIQNATIANNSASFGGGFFIGMSEDIDLDLKNAYPGEEWRVTLDNSIVWGNTASVVGPNILGGYCDDDNDYTNPYITNSDIEGGRDGILFLTDDPAFNDECVPDLSSEDAESGHDGVYDNNIDTDPEFHRPTPNSNPKTDASGADWDLFGNSPAAMADGGIMGYLGDTVVPIPFLAILGLFGLAGIGMFRRKRKMHKA